MSQQELNGLREGYAEHSEAWLRERLREQSFPQMHGLAGAAGLPQHAGRRKLPKEELEPALWRSIAEQEASEGKDVREDDAAVSQQELNGLREGFAQHGEAWLRERLQEQSFPQMHGLAGAVFGSPQTVQRGVGAGPVAEHCRAGGIGGNGCSG